MHSLPGLSFHHTGCLVKNLEESIKYYRAVLPSAEVSPVYEIVSQKVRLVFLQLLPGVYLELVECSDENLSLGKLLKKGGNFYHIAFTTNHRPVSVVADELQAKGFRLISKFNSEAFDNKPCAFLFSPEMHMIELIES